MTVHFTNHDLYWLLPLAIAVILYKAKQASDSETGYIQGLAPLLVLLVGGACFFMLLSLILIINLVGK
jgi:hypothetical protein